MTDTLIVEALGFIVALIAVITPIVKLNNNIVKLNTTLEGIVIDNKTRDTHLTRHDEAIGEINKTVANHGARIKFLEDDRRDTDV